MPCNWRCKIYCGAGIPHHSYKISIRCSDPFIPFLRSFFWHGSWASLLDMCNANEQKAMVANPWLLQLVNKAYGTSCQGKKRLYKSHFLLYLWGSCFRIHTKIHLSYPYHRKSHLYLSKQGLNRGWKRLQDHFLVWTLPSEFSRHQKRQPIEMNASPGNRRIYIYILSCYTSNKS